MSYSIRDLRLFFLIAAIAIYAVAGAPTPERAGIAELIVGLLLVTSIGLRDSVAAIMPVGARPFWFRAGQIFLLYGLCVPLVSGVASGASLTAIVRDVIPFLFMAMPLFLANFVSSHPRGPRLVRVAVIGLGCVFAARVAAPVLGVEWWGASAPPHTPDPLRLANAPSVAFAAMILAGWAGRVLYERVNARTLAASSVMIALAAIPVLAMAIVVQRASFGLGAVGIGVLMAVGLARAPARMAGPALLLGVVCALAWPVLHDIAASLIHKNTLVGANMRFEEAAAVANSFAGRPVAMMFGQGWGAGVESPAVGGAFVTFTHSLPTTLWLKTGLVGLVLGMTYLGGLAAGTIRLLRADPVMAIALGVPMAIDYVLYASFKSLDFGLILLLSAVYAQGAFAAQTLPWASGCCMQEPLPQDHQ